MNKWKRFKQRLGALEEGQASLSRRIDLVDAPAE